MHSGGRRFDPGILHQGLIIPNPLLLVLLTEALASGVDGRRKWLTKSSRHRPGRASDPAPPKFSLPYVPPLERPAPSQAARRYENIAEIAGVAARASMLFFCWGTLQRNKK